MATDIIAHSIFDSLGFGKKKKKFISPPKICRCLSKNRICKQALCATASIDWRICTHLIDVIHMNQFAERVSLISKRMYKNEYIY